MSNVIQFPKKHKDQLAAESIDRIITLLERLNGKSSKVTVPNRTALDDYRPSPDGAVQSEAFYRNLGYNRRDGIDGGEQAPRPRGDFE